jgi:hypothetical protein
MVISSGFGFVIQICQECNKNFGVEFLSGLHFSKNF